MVVILLQRLKRRRPRGRGRILSSVSATSCATYTNLYLPYKFENDAKASLQQFRIGTVLLEPPIFNAVSPRCNPSLMFGSHFHVVKVCCGKHI